MAKAKCFKCGASATAETFEQARKQINHAVGLSRGIKCGDNHGRVQEIKDTLQKPKVIPVLKTNLSNPESLISETKEEEEKTIEETPQEKPKKEKLSDKKYKTQKEKYL